MRRMKDRKINKNFDVAVRFEDDDFEVFFYHDESMDSMQADLRFNVSTKNLPKELFTVTSFYATKHLLEKK